MSPEQLQSQFRDILVSSFSYRRTEQGDGDEVFTLSDSDMFRLWNLLGEELGIDLSIASHDQRVTLLEACQNGRQLAPRTFGPLLWLMYYAETVQS